MADIHTFPDAPEGTPESKFVHLHVHSDYSLLDGASKLDSLIARAKEMNMKHLALTDHGNMFGILNFEHICHANKINPICGEEFELYHGEELCYFYPKETPQQAARWAAVVDRMRGLREAERQKEGEHAENR